MAHGHHVPHDGGVVAVRLSGPLKAPGRQVDVPAMVDVRFRWLQAVTPGRARRGGSLRRALVLRMLGIGLTTILISLVVLGLQIRRTAQEQAVQDAQRHANGAAADLTGLFADWRDELLIAAGNSAYPDWYERPDGRAATRARIDGALVALHGIYPDLIDEACFIDAQGPELSRQTVGEPAPASDLSPDESEAPFFRPTLALPAGQVYQASPYISEDSKRWVVSNSTPLVVAGQKVALLHFEANLDAVRTLIDRRLGTGMKARILDATTGSVIADTSSHEPIVDQPLGRTGAWQGAAGPVRASSTVDLGGNSANHWTVEVSRVSAQPFTATLLLQALTVLVLLAGLMIAVAFRLGTGISRPLRDVTKVAEAMAQGDLSSRATVDRDDDIGRMAGAVNHAIDVMSRQRDQLHLDYEARKAQLRDTQERQHRAEGEVRARAQALVDETAHAVRGELSELLEEVRQVQLTASTIAERVTGTSAATRSLVGQTVDADTLVTTLGDSLRRVGGIADLITGVASQTKLLALNATIEATRAGESGNGFGVVANEVKTLATETARSTGEITTTIGLLEKNAQAVATAIAGMSRSVSGIDTATSDVSTVTSQQLALVGRMEEVVQKATGRINGLVNIANDLERRQAPRTLTSGTFQVRTGTQLVTATLRDVSATGLGCLVARTLRLENGERVGMEVMVDGRPLTASAVVTRCLRTTAGTDLGLRFDDPDPQVVAALETGLADNRLKDGAPRPA